MHGARWRCVICRSRSPQHTPVYAAIARHERRDAAAGASFDGAPRRAFMAGRCSLPSRRGARCSRLPRRLLIALAGGVAFALLGLPAGLVSGSVLAVARRRLLGRPVKVPLDAGARLLRRRRHSARRRGDAGDAARRDDLAGEHRAFDRCFARHDAGDHELSARRAPLGPAVGADGREPGLDGAGHRTCRASSAAICAPSPSCRPCAFCCWSSACRTGSRLFGLVAPALSQSLRGPAGIFSVLGKWSLLAAVSTACAHAVTARAVSGRPDVRRHGRLGHPARHRPHPCGAAMVDRRRAVDRARRGRRFALCQHDARGCWSAISAPRSAHSRWR